MSSIDKIILKSSDGESFEVEEAVALQSRTIDQMFKEKDFPDDGIPLHNVTSGILSKVIDYCKMHVVDTDRDSSAASDDVKDQDPLQCPSLTRSSVEESRLESGFGGRFSAILSKVIKYCKKHVVNTDRDSSVAGDDLKAWDAEFVKVDQATLFDLILAANYLNIKGLLDLTCQTVADKIKGKTPEEIKRTFGIKKNFTPDEEEEIRRENQWGL